MHAKLLVAVGILFSCLVFGQEKETPRNAYSSIQEFKIKREAIFEFAKKPIVTSEGDKITITFETKALCDVTIAIETNDGKMIRNLVSGVLGPNAPEPFIKNSKKQSIIWDGKSDAGIYVDDKANCSVRVSLGLQPKFERNLFHSNYKLWGRNPPIFTATPEGVYVFEGDNVDSIKLFDHTGNYIKTTYPFPANKIEQVKGLRWQRAYQDGFNTPLKEGFYQSTFFTSGYNSGYDSKTGYGVTHYPMVGLGWAENAPNFPAATAMAIHNGKIMLAGVLGLNRLATDGSSGGLELNGPRNSRKAIQKLMYGKSGETVFLSPRSIAISPDEEWLYLTGFNWLDETDHYWGRQWLHSVLRVKVNSQAEPEIFIGVTNQEPGKPGNGPNDLYSPMAVTCDSKGNLFVADFGNNRIQVFSADGKLIESIPANRPTNLRVHPKTDELYVFSWKMAWDATNVASSTKAPPVAAMLTIIGPTGKRHTIASYPLPFIDYKENIAQYHELGGVQYQVELDPWAEKPTLWIVPGSVWQPTNAGESNISWNRGAIKIAVIANNKLSVVKEFGKETIQKTAHEAPTSNGRQILAVNPVNQKLYVLENLVSNMNIVEIDPETGKERLLVLPHATDDICFDMEGHLYLNTGSTISRFNLADMREIPWDYGEERNVGGNHGTPVVRMISTLVLPGKTPPVDEKSHTCGMAMSPNNLLAVYCWNGEDLTKASNENDKKKPVTSNYVPPIFEGRQRWGELHVWDKQGKARFTDAIPGLGFTDGVAIDKDNNLYVMVGSTQVLEWEVKLNPKTCTLIKFKPNKGKIITDGEFRVPLPLKKSQLPKTQWQLTSCTQPKSWVLDAEWSYGGVGYCGWEWSSRFALDLYARSFVPETDHFSIAVLDSNGNLILRIGKYGNIDDGKPIIADPEIKNTRSIGGDEVALMHPGFVGVQSDRRLFISDTGNRRIVSVKLDYATNETISLKNLQPK